MQKTSIKSTIRSQPQPPVSTETPAPLIPPGYFARVALAAGLCALAALSGLATLLLRAGLPIHPLDMGLVVLTLATLAGGLAGTFWTIRMVERPIRQEDALIYQEYEKMCAKIAELESHRANSPDVSGYQTHLALHELAHRHLTSQPTTKRNSGLDPKLHARALVIARAVGLYNGTGKGARWTTSDPIGVLEKLLLIADVTPQRAWLITPNGQISVALNPAGEE